MTESSIPPRANPLQSYIDEHAGQMTAVPLAHYEQAFAEADPALLSSRSGIPYETFAEEDAQSAQGALGAFHLTYLGRPLTVLWPTLRLSYDDAPETPLAPKEIIVISDLLLHGQLVPSSGRFVPYSEVPWGAHYFKAFEGRCLKRFAFMFTNADAFSAAAAHLEATPAEGADASWDFRFVDPVIVRFSYWNGDDEYPQSTQILFSDNAQFAFTAEDLAVAGDILLGKLKGAREALRAQA